MVWPTHSATASPPRLTAGFMCFAGCLFAGGCSSGTAVATGSLADTVKATFHGFGAASVTVADVRSVPYASLGYQIGDGTEQMLVLAGSVEAQLVWTSAAKITLVTQNGRIVRTLGLQHDLSALLLTQTSAQTWQVGATSTWEVQLDEPETKPESITCTVESATPDVVSILGRSLNTTRIEESCVSPELRWQFINRYWLDGASGIVWRSVQHTSPKLQPVTTELLRPYRPRENDAGATPSDGH